MGSGVRKQAFQALRVLSLGCGKDLGHKFRAELSPVGVLVERPLWRAAIMQCRRTTYSWGSCSDPRLDKQPSECIHETATASAQSRY